MSRICRNMGDSEKLRFYELDHDESKMRLLKPHSHTSNGLAMEPGTREGKQMKEAQTLQQGKSHPSKTVTYRRCGGEGGRKGSRTCRIPQVWRGGQERCKVIGGDTECPLQVCQLSRSSESTHFLSLRRDIVYSIPPEPRIASEIGGTCLRSIS